MHRRLAVRATPPLLVAMALATALAVGAQAAWAPAPSRADGPVVEVAHVEGVATTAGRVLAASPSSVALGELGSQSVDRRRLAGTVLAGLAAPATTTASATVRPTSKAAPTAKASPTRVITTRATTTSTATTTSAVWWSRYRGTNHVWMPTLGLSKAVYFYACDRSTYPSNVVYRWGCGGTNNVYLFGHNFGVFYPLYHAWRTGTLRKGMPVVYADGQGHTHLYRVTTWRVVLNTDGAWAIASQPVPSMTLQTCAATSGPYRLVVRLVAAAR